MKTKKLVLILFAVLVFALIILPNKAYATESPETTEVIELCQDDFDAALEAAGAPTEKGIFYNDEYSDFCLKPGEYLFTDNIDLGENSIWIYDGAYVFDLNENTLSSSESEATIYLEDGNLTITGNGTITSENHESIFLWGIVGEAAEVKTYLTIENGTFIGGITLKAAVATIRDANVEGPVKVDYFSSAVIDDGNFSSTTSDAIYVLDGSSITINGGFFDSPYNGLMVESWDGFSPKSIIINGGRFASTGEVEEESLAGFVFFEAKEIILNGGIFIGEGNALGGILGLVDGETPEEGFEALLGENRCYEPALELSETVFADNVFATQAEISVIDPSDLEDEIGEIEITDGADQTFEGKDLTITCSGGFAAFVGLEMDGFEVNPENYTATNGSTIVTLKSAYLASLDAGVHTLGFVYSNGEKTETTITIPEPEAEAETEPGATSITPKTGDNIIIYIALFVIAAVAMISMIIAKIVIKRRK